MAEVCCGCVLWLRCVVAEVCCGEGWHWCVEARTVLVLAAAAAARLAVSWCARSCALFSSMTSTRGHCIRKAATCTDAYDHTISRAEKRRK